MKKSNLLMILSFLFAAFLASCEKDDNNSGNNSIGTKNAYIFNYGSYSGSKSEISIYNIDSMSMSHDAFETANGVEFSSNIQSVTVHNDIAYFMSNNGDKIDIVDANTLEVLANPISADITKPRYFVAEGNTGYASCWGDVQDWGAMATSYIAKIDLTTYAVEKIAIAGGTEGLIIVNNKLYVGLTATNKVAVVDLSNDAISYIDVQAIAQHFVLDANGKIWVSLVSTYSAPFGEDKIGMAIIDPTTDAVEANINFTGMGSSGYIQISPDKKTIYAMGAEAWPGTATTIYTVDVDTKALSSTALVSGESYYGFNISPYNGDVYVLISPSATEAGKLKIYDAAGTLLDEEETGIGPQNVVFHTVD